MRLPALQITDDRYAIAQFDHVERIAEVLGLDLETETGRQYLAHLKILFTNIISPEVSGIILEPMYGFGALEHLNPQVGLALRLEGLGHGLEKAKQPKLLPEWGVEHVRNNFAVAKVEIAYHPSETEALFKKQFLAELKDFCHYEGVDLLAVVRLFNPDGGILVEDNYEQALLETLSELGRSCQMIGLEYPQNPLLAATITAELDIPWLLVSSHVSQAESYDDFKQRVRESLEAGSSGFIVGDVVWRELEELRRPDMSPDWDRIQHFLETTVRDRVIELRRIAQEH